MCKRLISILLSSCFATLIISCSNDIILFDPIDPIPVVYGIICPDDSVSQIKLSKSFGSDFMWTRDAKINDSMYYANAEVYIDFRSDSGFVLERVQLVETIIEDKEDGMFSTSPNKVYQATGLNLRYPFLGSGEMTYHLTINIPDYNKSVYSQVTMPPKPPIKTNIGDKELINFYNYFFEPKFIEILLDQKFTTELDIVVNYDEQINNRWYPEKIMYHREYGVGNPSHSRRDTLHFSPGWFYNMMKNRIKENSEVKIRRFKSIDIQKKLVSIELSYYQKSHNFQSDFYTKSFSNIVNGKGVFACYSKNYITGIRLHPQSLDSLASGQYTKHLKFIRW